MLPVGLPVLQVARMQAASGNPWVAFLTLTTNKVPPDKARAFVQREMRKSYARTFPLLHGLPWWAR